MRIFSYLLLLICFPSGHVSSAEYIRDALDEKALPRPQLPECPPLLDAAVKKTQNLGHPIKDAPSSVVGHAQICEAVVGPLPKEFDCSEGRRVPIYDRDGLEVTMGEDGKHYKQGKPFSIPPNWADWCLSPSLAPGFAYKACRIGSSLIWKKKGGVTWAAFCRAKSDLKPGETTYESMSVMGWNENGEVCQFDYQPRGTNLVFTKIPSPIVPWVADDPKTISQYSWIAPASFQSGNNCITCHAINGPMIKTPYIKGTGIDLSSAAKTMRLVGHLGSQAQGLKRNPPQVITPLVKDEKTGKMKEDRTCIGCHQLTTSAEFILDYTVGLKNHGKRDWAELSDVTPWMPGGIERASPHQLKKYQEAVKRLKHCIEFPEDQVNCGPRKPVLADCPKPQALKAKSVSVTHTPGTAEPAGFSESVLISWQGYEDQYGKLSGNPMRDDIRFKLTLSGSDGAKCVFEDIQPSKGRIEIPAKRGITYQISLEPVRHCLDYEMRQTTASPVEKSVRIPASDLEGNHPNPSGGSGVDH